MARTTRVYSVPEPDSSIVYFQILGTLACYCRQLMTELPRTSYPKLQQGYLSLVERYGNDNVVANRFAFMATIFGDKPSAREAFAEIQSMVPDVWQKQEEFDQTREWANSPQ